MCGIPLTFDLPCVRCTRCWTTPPRALGASARPPCPRCSTASDRTPSCSMTGGCMPATSATEPQSHTHATAPRRTTWSCSRKPSATTSRANRKRSASSGLRPGARCASVTYAFLTSSPGTPRATIASWDQVSLAPTAKDRRLGPHPGTHVGARVRDSVTAGARLLEAEAWSRRCSLQARAVTSGRGKRRRAFWKTFSRPITDAIGVSVHPASGRALSSFWLTNDSDKPWLAVWQPPPRRCPR